MAHIKVKNMPRLGLNDLLRRRKMTLQQLLTSFGITTYTGLVNHCDRIGVLAPSEGDFKAASPSVPVNNPQEGVVVVEPMPVYYVDELSGKKIDPGAPTAPGVMVVTDVVIAEDDTVVVSNLDLLEGPQKKPRRKKEATPVE